MTSASNPESLLASVGISLVSSQSHPQVYAELFRAARRLRETGRTTVGLLPSGPRVAVPPVAIGLASALADLAQGAVAVVDANTRLPALGALAALAPSGSSCPPEAASAEGGFATAWIRDGLAVLTMAQARPGGLDLALVESAVRQATSSFAHVLVDLTGFAPEGQHWGAFELLDGVLVVAQTAVSREAEMVTRCQELPRELDLGVLLVG